MYLEYSCCSIDYGIYIHPNATRNMTSRYITNLPNHGTSLPSPRYLVYEYFQVQLTREKICRLTKEYSNSNSNSSRLRLIGVWTRLSLRSAPKYPAYHPL